MTLGQEFSTYAVMLEEDEARLREARMLIQEINLGATAIGTGINAPAGYAERACQELAEISGIPVVDAGGKQRGEACGASRETSAIHHV